MKNSADFDRLEAVKARLASRNIGEAEVASRINAIVNAFKDAHGDEALAAAEGVRVASALLDTERNFAEKPFTAGFSAARGEGSCGRFKVVAVWCIGEAEREDLDATFTVSDGALGLEFAVCANILDDGAATLCTELHKRGFATGGVIEALGAAVESADTDMDAKMESLKAALDDMAGTKLEGTVVERCRRLRESGLDTYSRRAAETHPAAIEALAALADIGERDAGRLHAAARVLDFFMPPSGVAPEAYLAGRGLRISHLEPEDFAATLSMRPGDPVMKLALDNGFDEMILSVRKGGTSLKGDDALKFFLSSRFVADGAARAVPGALRSLGERMSDAVDAAHAAAQSLLEAAASELGVDASPEAVRRALAARNMPVAEAESLAFDVFRSFADSAAPLLAELAGALDRLSDATGDDDDLEPCPDSRGRLAGEGSHGRYRATATVHAGDAAALVAVEDTTLRMTCSATGVNLQSRSGAAALCKALRLRGLANTDALAAVGAALGAVGKAAAERLAVARTDLAMLAESNPSAGEVASIPVDRFAPLRDKAAAALERLSAAVESRRGGLEFAGAVFEEFGGPERRPDTLLCIDGEELNVAVGCDGWNFSVELYVWLDGTTGNDVISYPEYGMETLDKAGAFLETLLRRELSCHGCADDLAASVGALADEFVAVADGLYAEAVKRVESLERVLAKETT